MTRINQSWREQRKAVVGTDVGTGKTFDWISLWQASHHVAVTMLCKPETARKEIKRAILTGKPRYGMIWKWSPPTPQGGAFNTTID